MTPLWILVAAHASTVEIDGARWRALQAPEDVEEEAPEPSALSREVWLEPGEEEVGFRSTWRLWSPEKQWYEARITGPGVHVAEARFAGRELAITEAEDGVRIAVELDGEGTLELRGVAVGDPRRGPVTLDLLPAAVGRVRVATEAEPTISAAGPVVQLRDGIWTGASGLAILLSDPTPPVDRPDLAIATSALGLTVGEATYDARARVRWEVRHGELSTVELVGRGVGADLELTGPAVASWTRSGDRISVTLREPEDALVDLALSWSGAVPGGDEGRLELPRLEPQGAFKTEASVQLARDGELEVVPRLDAWTAVPFAALPEWGRGLVVGTPTATFAAGGVPQGDLALFRFTPVSGPPTFVDVATITAAATARGTVLLRAHYAVRNDRSAHLRITPPPGARVVGARVAARTARIARDGDTLLLPLEKSVETVEGLLSFPVELILLVEDADWSRREARSLPLPRVEAPVAVTRATLHLPPGYASRLDDGEGDVVGVFSDGEGIAYGKATGESARAEALMQEAVQAWMGNSFEDAEALLDELEAMGGLDENARKLQSNLDVISGKAEGQYDVALERRVKEQAKARSLEDQRAQEEALQRAEEQYLSGDYKAAEEGYREALELGKKLDKLEQKESVEVATKNVALESQLARTREQVAEKKKKEKVAPAKAVASGSSTTTYTLDGVNISDPSRDAAKPRPAASPTPARPDSSGSPEGDELERDLLQKMPAGRSYQSAIGVAAGVQGGVVGGATENRNEFSFADEDIGGELLRPDADAIATDASSAGVLGVLGSGAGGGGVADGAAGDDFEPLPVEEPEPEPTVGTVQTSSEMVVVERRGPRIRIPRVKLPSGKDKTAASEPPPPPVDQPQLVRRKERFEELDLEEERATPEEGKPPVRAAQLTTVIPTTGEAVRYEHLLLEAGAAYALTIDATSRRRDR